MTILEASDSNSVSDSESNPSLGKKMEIRHT
jgi:hypothetical protein